jgi:hypothetical protein
LHDNIKLDQSKIIKVFRVLYKNSSSYYSDSPDERRLKSRRAACFASLALLSDLENGFTFVEYAKFSLAQNTMNPIFELLEEPYLGLMFLELLFKHEARQSIENDLSDLLIFIEKNEENLSKEIIKSANKLIKEYQERN